MFKIRRWIRLSTVFAALLICSPAQAAAAWYQGKVTRIFMHTDGFILTFVTNALDDCIHNYVYYRVSILGDKTVDRALSIALAANAQDKTVGVVIDKSIDGPGGICDANGSMDIVG